MEGMTHAESRIRSTLLYYNISVEELQSAKRNRRLSEIRQVLATLLRSNYGWTLKQIGELMGGRDHTTVLHMLKTYDDALHTRQHYALEGLQLINM